MKLKARVAALTASLPGRLRLRTRSSTPGDEDVLKRRSGSEDLVSRSTVSHPWCDGTRGDINTPEISKLDGLDTRARGDSSQAASTSEGPSTSNARNFVLQSMHQQKWSPGMMFQPLTEVTWIDTILLARNSPMRRDLRQFSVLLQKLDSSPADSLGQRRRWFLCFKKFSCLIDIMGTLDRNILLPLLATKMSTADGFTARFLESLKQLSDLSKSILALEANFELGHESAWASEEALSQLQHQFQRYLHRSTVHLDGCERVLPMAFSEEIPDDMARQLLSQALTYLFDDKLCQQPFKTKVNYVAWFLLHLSGPKLAGFRKILDLVTPETQQRLLNVWMPELRDSYMYVLYFGVADAGTAAQPTKKAGSGLSKRAAGHSRKPRKGIAHVTALGGSLHNL